MCKYLRVCKFVDSVSCRSGNSFVHLSFHPKGINESNALRTTLRRQRQRAVKKKGEKEINEILQKRIHKKSKNQIQRIETKKRETKIKSEYSEPTINAYTENKSKRSTNRRILNEKKKQLKEAGDRLKEWVKSSTSTTESEKNKTIESDDTERINLTPFEFSCSLAHAAHNSSDIDLGIKKSRRTIFSTASKRTS